MTAEQATREHYERRGFLPTAQRCLECGRELNVTVKPAMLTIGFREPAQADMEVMVLLFRTECDDCGQAYKTKITEAMNEGAAERVWLRIERETKRVLASKKITKRGKGDGQRQISERGV